MARDIWPEVPITELQAQKRWALNGGPFGSKLVSRDYVGEGVPVIRGANLPSDRRFSHDDFVFVSEAKADELLANNAHPGDVVFTQRGTLGQVGIIPTNSPYRRFVISQSQMKMTVDESRVDAKWLFYCFRNPITQQAMINRASSSGVPHINLGVLREFRIRLPGLTDQRRIASILSAYDDLIENNTRRIAILEEMARRIYEEWFVRFRFPGHEGARMVESELGLVPETWPIVRLDDVLVLQRGFDLPKQDRTEGSFPIISATGAGASHHEYKVNGPGVVTGRSGSLGTVIYVEGNFWPLNTTLWVKQFAAGSPLYAFYVLQSVDLVGFNSGAAVPTLNRNDVHGLPVLRPTPHVLSAFDEAVGPMIKLKRRLELKNENLRATRDLLLPKLISGELDVSALPEPQPIAA